MFIVKAIYGSFTFYLGTFGWTEDAKKVQPFETLSAAERALLGCAPTYKRLQLQQRWIEEL